MNTLSVFALDVFDAHQFPKFPVLNTRHLNKSDEPFGESPNSTGFLQDFNEQCYEYSGSSSNPLDRFFLKSRAGTDFRVGCGLEGGFLVGKTITEERGKLYGKFPS